MSWFTRIPYNRVLNAVLEFVRETTDPYLNLFRQVRADGADRARARST